MATSLSARQVAGTKQNGTERTIANLGLWGQILSGPKYRVPLKGAIRVPLKVALRVLLRDLEG